MKMRDIRALFIVEIIVAVALLLAMYYVHVSLPIDPPIRVYMIPGDPDPCPELLDPAIREIGMLFAWW